MSRKTIRATLKLKSTEEGGRNSAILSGYRSLVRFEGSELDFGFELELEERLAGSGLLPGMSGEGWLSIWAGDILPVLRDGHRFELREGARVIGTGVVMASNHEGYDR